MTIILRIVDINNEVQNLSAKLKSTEAVKEFYELYLPYYKLSKSIIGQLGEARRLFKRYIKKSAILYS